MYRITPLIYGRSKTPSIHKKATQPTIKNQRNLQWRSPNETDKIKTNSIVKGKHETQEEFILQDSDIIENMGSWENTYKYLGYLQKIGIEHENTTKKLKAK